MVIPDGQSTTSHSMAAAFQTVPDGQGTGVGSSDGDRGNISGSSHWRSSAFQTLPFGQRRSSAAAADAANDEDVDTAGWQVKLPAVLIQVSGGRHECLPVAHSSTSTIHHHHHHHHHRWHDSKLKFYKYFCTFSLQFCTNIKMITNIKYSNPATSMIANEFGLLRTP